LLILISDLIHDFHLLVLISDFYLRILIFFALHVVLLQFLRAAASLSPDVSRRVFKMARRSNSSKGRISLLSGTRSLVPYCKLLGKSDISTEGPDPSATDHAMAFSSSRTFPGQS
jgi:hypothetical protein